jgi:TIR domain-containing protein
VNDIFLSYANQDRDAARKLAHVFKDAGLSVFWDREIPVGKSWDRVVEEQLPAAGVVTPLWSPRSIASDWVMIEATEGMERKKLFPALIDPTPIPLRFKLTQFADLSDWDGTATHDGCARLLNAIAGHLGIDLPTSSRQQQISTRRERRSEAHDVFLGYARSDEDSARALVSALSAAQVTVWWDRAIVVGESFDNTILRALEQARAVIILWSQLGVRSDWVRAEAQWAIEQGVLINVSIDGVPSPEGFSTAPSVNLVQWDRKSMTMPIQILLENLVDKGVSVVPNRMSSRGESDRRRAAMKWRVIWIAVIAIVLAALGLGIYIGRILGAGG